MVKPLKAFTFYVPDDVNFTINLENVAITEIKIESWCHSGLVSATLQEVPLLWLLEKIQKEIKEKGVKLHG